MKTNNTKKLFLIVTLLSSFSAAFADGNFTGKLTVNTNTLATPYINASSNTLQKNGNTLNGYTQLDQGITDLTFNTLMKNGGYMPYNISFGMSFGGLGINQGTVAWTANGDTPGSSYTFSITPPVYPVGQAPGADYCISVTVDGNVVAQNICSIAIQKTDSYASDIWYFPGAVTNVTVSNFNANSNVSVNYIAGNAKQVQCHRSSEWDSNPVCN